MLAGALVDRIDVVLMNYLGFLGFDVDRLKLLIYFYSCVPLGFWFHSIKNDQMRLAFNLAIGLFFTLLLGKEFITFINVTTIVVFLITQLYPAKCVIPVFIVSFAALSYVHIYRLIYDYLSWKMDYNAIQMMVTCRYMYYAVERQDGLVKASFFEYYSYIFMFPNLIIGPVQCKHFLDLIYRRDQFENLDKGYKKSYALINLGKAILLSLGEVLIRPYFDYDWYDRPEWKQMNLVYKHAFQQLIGISTRFRYFCAFKYTQSGMDAIGISYNQKSDKFDLYSTGDYNYEREKNTILKTQQWNTTVQIWLKFCFFDRIQKSNGQSMAFYTTFVASALWHGFYLTYYLFFFWWALMIQNAKYTYRARHKFACKLPRIPKSIQNVIVQTYNGIVINSTAICVAILDWDRAVSLTNDLYWSSQIIIVALFLFFTLTQYGQKSHSINKMM